MNIGACAHSAKVGIVARGRHAVAQEDVNHIGFRVHPVASAGESGVAHRFGACFGASARPFGFFHPGFVEAQTAVRIGALGIEEGFHRGELQVAVATVGAAIEPHLEEFAKVVGIGKQSRIALHASREGSQLIVHIAMDVLSAQVGVHFGVGNLMLRKSLKRAIHGVESPKRCKNLILHKGVERLLIDDFHSIGKLAEIEATVKILLFAQLRGIDACHNGIVGGFAAPQSFGNG